MLKIKFYRRRNIEIKIRYLWKEPTKSPYEMVERKEINLKLQAAADKISQSIREALEIIIE